MTDMLYKHFIVIHSFSKNENILNSKLNVHAGFSFFPLFLNRIVYVWQNESALMTILINQSNNQRNKIYAERMP